MARKSKKDKQQNGHANGNAATSAAPDAVPAPAKAPAGAKRLKAYKQELPVKNNDAQQRVIGGQLADVILEKGRVGAEKLRIESEKKRALDEVREKITELEEREFSLARDFHNGTHEDRVEVVEYLLPTNEVQVVRSDTGEVIETRTATSEDLQDDLFPPTLDGPKTEPAAPEPAPVPETAANDGTAITAPQDLLNPVQPPAAPAGE